MREVAQGRLELSLECYCSASVAKTRVKHLTPMTITIDVKAKDSEANPPLCAFLSGLLGGGAASELKCEVVRGHRAPVKVVRVDIGPVDRAWPVDKHERFAKHAFQLMCYLSLASVRTGNQNQRRQKLTEQISKEFSPLASSAVQAVVKLGLSVRATSYISPWVISPDFFPQFDCRAFHPW